MIAIGNAACRELFCAFTGPPTGQMQMDPELHCAMGVEEGLTPPIGPWTNLLLMCAGVGFPAP
ncbi:hypothetical protein [Cyanobium sp. ATX 6A2]|uniref:hypothetical protein n=1 Tax=Cyanobium sp. ATX 6A2 TaxID=2823700 RepID=UPI0028F4288A|nr:hypothetical protein [Cyanobium sp. ATX 6A2]